MDTATQQLCELNAFPWIGLDFCFLFFFYCFTILGVEHMGHQIIILSSDSHLYLIEKRYFLVILSFPG